MCHELLPDATFSQEGFEHGVRQWVFPEKVLHEGKEACLTEIINTKHQNVKYLPGVNLPENVVAEGDLASAVQDATILIFVLPHQVRPSGVYTRIRRASLRRSLN